MYDDDIERLAAGVTLYDAFYRWCRDATSETHMAHGQGQVVSGIVANKCDAKLRSNG
jgi:hypothetical protein